MKILHIFSNSFGYFDDIKSRVWRLVEWQKQEGWDVEVLALGYGATKEQEKQEIFQVAPGTVPAGLFDLRALIPELDKFDAVHIHCPFLGVGGIWRYLKKHPRINLLVTFYEPTPISDLFSYFLRIYNGYYLPKFFSRARVIFCWREADFTRVFGRRYFSDRYQVADLTLGGEAIIRRNIHLTPRANQVKLTKEDGPYLACIEVYYNLFK